MYFRVHLFIANFGKAKISLLYNLTAVLGGFRFAVQTRLFIALSQPSFAKARLKTSSETQVSCKSFYKRSL